MLSIEGKPGRLCDSLLRREVVRMGGVGWAGPGPPGGVPPRPRGSVPSRAATGSGGPRWVSRLYRQAPRTHLAFWDRNPNPPAEIRGEFKPIATNIPGIQLSETLPL